jgi:hypothetical protein
MVLRKADLLVGWRGVMSAGVLVDKRVDGMVGLLVDLLAATMVDVLVGWLADMMVGKKAQRMVEVLVE